MRGKRDRAQSNYTMESLSKNNGNSTSYMTPIDQSESYILAVIMQHPDQREAMIEGMALRGFSVDAHAVLFENMRDMGAELNPASLAERLKKKRKLTAVGGAVRTTELSIESVDLSYLQYHLENIDHARELRVAADLHEKFGRALESGDDPRALVEDALSMLNRHDGVDAYYDLDRKEFLVENREGIWISHNETQFKRHLRSIGYSTKTADSLVSPAERVMLDLIDRKSVSYAAPLSGRRSGFYHEGGVRFLVTESHRLADPEEGGIPNILAIVQGLLGGEDYGEQQVGLFLGWLRAAVQSLRAGIARPGQALAIAGPADCGKSLLQKIITVALGGRSAKAALFLTGRTPFNAELFEAEHLMLEDESMSPDIRSRRALADAIKAIVVNEVHSCHRKQRTAVNLRPWWRLSISVNDDPEAMNVLPPLDDNIADKVTLLKARRFEMPMPGETLEERREFWATVEDEVPKLIHYLESTETPEKLVDRRYGVISWHHPDLVEDLHQLSGEQHLLDLIDRAIFESPTSGDWAGTHDELKAKLLDDQGTSREAGKLLDWRNATGTLLGKLAKKKPDRVKEKRTAQKRTWVITPPES